jgi:hypothetical protein
MPIGRKQTDDTKRKLQAIHKGKHYSPDTEFKKGENNWIGKHHTEVTKEKLRLVRKGKKMPQCGKKGRVSWNKGLRGCQTAWNKGLKGYLSGNKNPNWKGGITDKNVSLRSCVDYHLWRETIYEKNSYSCQKCGDNTGGNLEAHHICNFADYPDLVFAIDNGIAFCKNCHHEFHRKYGVRYNTTEQIKQFLET